MGDAQYLVWSLLFVLLVGLAIAALSRRRESPTLPGDEAGLRKFVESCREEAAAAAGEPR